MHDAVALYVACSDAGSERQRAAFEHLWAYVYSCAWRMLRDRADGEALAADCAQQSLIKIHTRLAECRDPARFLAWSGQIARRTVLDELRRPHHTRRATLDPADERLADPTPVPYGTDLRAVLMAALAGAAISDRSRRVIVGRFFDEHPDDQLAQVESGLAGHAVQPAQIQVTRAKNLAKLRGDAALLARLRDLMET